MKKERHKVVPEAYLILVKDNKTLLSKRFNTGYCDGLYGLVSGHVEEGETYLQAIIREAEEEAGLSLKEENIFVAHIMHRVNGSDTRMGVYFIAKIWGNDPTNMELNKCSDLSWFELQNLPENIIPYIKSVLENVEKKIFFSERTYE